MDPVWLALRLVLVVVFLISGVAKLFDREGSGEVFAGFGVPAPLLPLAVTLTPILEIVIALGLIPARFVPWSGALATATFLVFTGVVTTSVLQGKTHNCHCFGNLGRSPLGWRTVSRNIALTLAAALVWWQGSAEGAPSLLRLVDSPQDVAIILLTLVVAALGWLVLQLWRQQARLLLRLERLEHASGRDRLDRTSVLQSPHHRPLPDLALTDLTGKPVVLASLRSQARPMMVVMTSPTCRPCELLLPEIARWQREHAQRFTIALISSGKPADVLAGSRASGLTNVLLQRDRDASKALAVSGTPCAFVIDPGGLIRGEAACGADAIRTLIDDLASAPAPLLQPAQRPTPTMSRIGTTFPASTRRDLEGHEVIIGGDAETDTMLVFWNPSCGFCQRMAPDLRDMEDTLRDRTRIIIVSQGSTADNRAFGFRSPVVIDDGFRIGATVGASGTPSAIRLDRKGVITSDIAVGAPAVLYLGKQASGVPVHHNG